MSRFRVRPKAYEITLGATTVVVSPEVKTSLSGCGRSAATRSAWDELLGKKLHCDRVVGNRKFELSSASEILALRKQLEKLNPAAKARAKAREAAAAKRYAAWNKQHEAKQRRAEQARVRAERGFLKENPLPAGLLPADIADPGYDSRVQDETLGKAIQGHWSSGTDRFEVWYTERFGWVVPTLVIRDVPGYRARRQVPDGTVRRSYAVVLRDGSLVRCGMGPHVLKSLTVYLRKGSVKRLRPIIARIHDGAVKASVARDELSTRRMTGRRRWGGGF